VLLDDNTCHCKTEDGFYIRPNTLGKDECLPCHRLCKQCHGPTRDDCDECRTDTIPLLKPIEGNSCLCLEGNFDDDQKTLRTEYCQPCHEFCAKCDVTKDNCSECIDNNGIANVNSKCLCDRIGYFVYQNTTINKEQCVRCHPLCTKCFGPYNTQCNGCDISVGAIDVGSKTCECLPHNYYDKTEQRCVPCDALCGNCIGPGSKECTNCNQYNAYSVIDQPKWCVISCTELDGYFKYEKMCASIFDDFKYEKNVMMTV